MYISPHGKAEGLPGRLEKWADDLSKDTRYPWAGLGIIADLKAAAAMLSGKPVPAEKSEKVFDL